MKQLITYKKFDLILKNITKQSIHRNELILIFILHSNKFTKIITIF